MSAALTIAGREVAEKRNVFLIAAIFAVAAWLAPLVPGLHDNPRAIIAVISGFLSIGLTLGAAAILGATMVPRDLSTGRMSFYFSRPAGAVAIWFGKLLGAAGIVAATFVISALPAFIAGPAAIHNYFSIPIPIGIALIAGASVILFFVGHGIGTMMVARSRWAPLDTIAFIIASDILAYVILSPLTKGGAVAAAKIVGWSAAIAFVIACLIAGARQLAEGRTDRQRGHASFAKVIWGSVALFLVAAGGFTAWVTTPSAADLESPFGALQANSHALIFGTSASHFGFHPLFLSDVASGATERLGSWSRWGNAHFSRNGNELLAVEPKGNLFVRDVRPGAAFVDTSVAAGPYDPLAATDDGSRVALVHNGVLTIYDTQARRSLGSARVDGNVRWLFFATPNLLRMYAVDRNEWTRQPETRTIDVSEFDLTTHAMQHMASLMIPARILTITASPDGSRVLIRTFITPLLLCDGRTLQEQAQFDASAGVFLADGRIATVHVDRVNDSSLAVSTADGVTTKTIDLPGTRSVYVPFAVAPTKIALSTFDRDTAKRQTLIVDIDRGVVRRDTGLMPPFVDWTGGSGPGDPREPIAFPQRIMTDTAHGSMIRWNALTGEKTRVD